MENIQIEVSETITPEHLVAIEEGLNAFNDHITGLSDRKPLSVVVRDSRSGKVLGGMLGRTSLGLLFIDLLYLPPEHRSKGLGKELLHAFEEEGRRRGCAAAFLYTISFQAPDFYRKNGWVEFGRIDCAPEGTSRIFMQKKL